MIDATETMRYVIGVEELGMKSLKIRDKDIESLLGWRIVSRQDPPKHSINPLRVVMNAEASQSVLKKMSYG